MPRSAPARIGPSCLVLVLALVPVDAAAQACGFAFEELDSLGLPPPEAETRVVLRDLDADGVDEILVTYPTCPGRVFVVGSDGSTLSLLHAIGPADGLAGSPSGIDAVDVDLDGDTDLVVGHLEDTGCSSRGVTVLHRRADGTYGDAEFYAGDNDGRHLLALDLQGSGLPVVVTGDGPLGLNPTTGKAIQVRENEGPGDFDHVHEYGLQPSGGAAVPSLLAAGMLDGRPTGDILLFWGDRHSTAGLCNFGDTTFELLAERQVSPRGVGEATGAASSDLDGDGRLDLVVAYGDSGQIVIYLANTLGDARDCLLPGNGGTLCGSADDIAELAVADLDGDGLDDIVGVVTDEEQLALHGGGGSGTFGAVKRLDHDGRPVRVSPGRLAGDPRPDLAVLDEDGRLHLLQNTSVDDRCPRARAESQPIALADATCEGDLTLDGSGSIDPDGGALTYLWYENGELILETTERITRLRSPLGTRNFTLVVRDPAGNESRPYGVSLRLRDGVPPTLQADPPPPAECDGPTGALVLATATASDECTSVVISSQYGGGDVVHRRFPIGSTEIEWRARDGGSNQVRLPVQAVVVDSTPPALDCPSLVTVDCPGDGAAEVSLQASVADLCTEACDLLVDNDRGPGGADASGFYPPGDTLVTFRAEDAHGNVSTCESLVRVVDRGPPSLGLPPSPLVVDCVGSDGGFVALSADATDDCSDVVVANDRSGGADASGFYPLGETRVNWVATDEAGNEVFEQTIVEVHDLSGPELDCGERLLVECQGDRSGPASLRASAFDACDDDVTISNDRTAGGADASDDYPLGLTRVRFEAVDSAGNLAACTTEVRVQDSRAPELDCPALLRVGCDGGGEAEVSLVAQASDCCDPSPNVSNDRSGGGADASGPYPLGSTRVTFTAVDESGNAATCETEVLVEDTRPPLLACPSLVESECLGGAGTRVSLQALASDRCDPAPRVTNDRTAGGADATDVYPLGDTRVRFEAVDASGFAATCETIVRVADTLPPVALVETDDSCLWPPNHRFVRFRLGEEIRVQAHDLCAEEDELELEVLEVLSNEAEDGRGDGSTAPDVVVRDDELFLRAERSGGAPGRVYTLRLGVSDPSGNSAVADLEVRVPHGGNAPEGCKSLPPSRFLRDSEVLD